MIRPLIAVLATVAATLAACGGGSDTTATQSPTATATTSATAPGRATPANTPQRGIATMPGAGTRPVHMPATDTRVALLTKVRAARPRASTASSSSSAARLPGYDVRYVSRPIRQDGSGKILPIAGNHVVQVRMENALDADLTEPTAP